MGIKIAQAASDQAKPRRHKTVPAFCDCLFTIALGKKLGIERNGKKTFHSLRHTFATALFNSDVPELKVAQVLGHVRGKTISAGRYKKDSFPADLRHYVDGVQFELPALCPFSVPVGLAALKDALKAKERHAAEVAKKSTTKRTSR